MLAESLKAGLNEGFIKKSELTRLNVDSTVLEKVVRYPTDTLPYGRLHELLVKSARKMVLSCGKPTNRSRNVLQPKYLREIKSTQTGKKTTKQTENFPESGSSGH